MTRAAPCHPLLFFALIYGLSAPFWLLNTQWAPSGLPDNLPVSDIGAALTPTVAAAILRYREAGAGGVRELFLRTFDYRRIKDKRWLVCAVAIVPLLYLVTYCVMRGMDYPVPRLWSPAPARIGAFLLFFVAATQAGAAAMNSAMVPWPIQSSLFSLALSWCFGDLPSSATFSAARPARSMHKNHSSIRDAEMPNGPLWRVLAGCSARRSECGVACATQVRSNDAMRPPVPPERTIWCFSIP